MTAIISASVKVPPLALSAGRAWCQGVHGDATLSREAALPLTVTVAALVATPRSATAAGLAMDVYWLSSLAE